MKRSNAVHEALTECADVLALAHELLAAGALDVADACLVGVAQLPGDPEGDVWRLSFKPRSLLRDAAAMQPAVAGGETFVTIERAGRRIMSVTHGE